MKKLIVDIGNSIISFGVFNKDKLETRFDIPSNETYVAHIKDQLASFIKDKKLNTKEFDGGLISSVVPMFTISIKKAVKATFDINVNVLDESFYENIEMVVDDRKEVGGDIVADVMAAKTLFGGPTLVIDLGTITKNVVLDANSKFIGVSFFPGVEACVSAMRNNTALLPGFELDAKPEALLGNNTIDAMKSGVFYATLNGLKSLSEELDSKYHFSHRVLTGGNAKLFAPYLKDFIFDEDFVLKGINYLLKNRG